MKEYAERLSRREDNRAVFLRVWQLQGALVRSRELELQLNACRLALEHDEQWIAGRLFNVGWNISEGLRKKPVQVIVDVPREYPFGDVACFLDGGEVGGPRSVRLKLTVSSNVSRERDRTRYRLVIRAPSGASSLAIIGEKLVADNDRTALYRSRLVVHGSSHGGRTLITDDPYRRGRELEMAVVLLSLLSSAEPALSLATSS